MEVNNYLHVQTETVVRVEHDFIDPRGHCPVTATLTGTKTKICSTHYVWKGGKPGTPSAQVLIPVKSCQRGLVAQS